MRRSGFHIAIAVSLCTLALAGCPPPKGGEGGGGGGGGGGGSAGINPEACGNVSVSAVGRKLHAFLVASAELDRASIELEGSVKGACKRMATELGVSTEGDTETVCKRALAELDANLAISVSHETRLVTRTEPAVCKTEFDFTAKVAAECEASVSADINIQCEGSCQGGCYGECDGTCSATNAQGECEGQCQGVCRGSCRADCDGYANVDASVECKASAEVRASVNTTCSEPKVVVVQEDVTVVDTTKFDMAIAAINAGMPAILRAGAKAELVGKAIVLWAKTLGSLVKSSGDLVGELGQKGICLGAQLAAAFAAVVQVEARVSVSVDVSVQASASAGASGG